MIRCAPGHQLGQATSAKCFKEADLNSDGVLSFEEFEAWCAPQPTRIRGTRTCTRMLTRTSMLTHTRYHARACARMRRRPNAPAPALAPVCAHHTLVHTTRVTIPHPPQVQNVQDHRWCSARGQQRVR